MLQGFPGAQDYFNQILSGINQVIKTHMNEMHSKFETQFSSMAGEVRRRDAIIAQLQLKLRTVEQKSTVASTSRRLKREKLSQISVDDDEPGEQDNSSSGSSAELLFMVSTDSLQRVSLSRMNVFHSEYGTPRDLEIHVKEMYTYNLSVPCGESLPYLFYLYSKMYHFRILHTKFPVPSSFSFIQTDRQG